MSAAIERVGECEARALVTRVQRDRSGERLHRRIGLSRRKSDQPLDAMWLRAIGRELDRDRDVLGCAVERAVAQRRGRASQRTGFNTALRNEGIARHALPE